MMTEQSKKKLEIAIYPPDYDIGLFLGTDFITPGEWDRYNEEHFNKWVAKQKDCGHGISTAYYYILYTFRKFLPKGYIVKCCRCFNDKK